MLLFICSIISCFIMCIACFVYNTKKRIKAKKIEILKKIKD